MFSKIFAPFALVALAFATPLRAQTPSQPSRVTPKPNAMNAIGGGQADFQLAQDLASKGSTAQAIEAYRKFIKTYPTSPLASKAQYQIAILEEDSGNLSKAFDAYQTLVSRYPDTPEFEDAVAKQVIIANEFLQGRKLKFLGLAILPGTERAQEMYTAILKNAPFSKHAPVAQFNLGLTYERQKAFDDAHHAYQTVLDKYGNSDVADDALYQIAYMYMRAGLTGNSQDLSSLILAKETYEDFLSQYPKSEKVAQAHDNLKAIGDNEAADLMRIAKYYDWSKNFKAAAIYYNDVVRKQPSSPDAALAKTRIEELRGNVGDDALRVGSERAESGEQLALRRRLQAQVETSSLADYDGPSKRDIVPDELPISKTPKLRTDVRDVQPMPAVEPLLPSQ